MREVDGGRGKGRFLLHGDFLLSFSFLIFGFSIVC
jgi:hypothetical protein